MQAELLERRANMDKELDDAKQGLRHAVLGLSQCRKLISTLARDHDDIFASGARDGAEDSQLREVRENGRKLLGRCVSLLDGSFNTKIIQSNRHLQK